jgi:hypothetical protein
MKNISKFISPVFLVFSIFLLINIFYRSEVYYSGTKLDYYLKYYIISGAIITFSIASFFIQKDIKIKIALFFVSTIFALYLVEGYLDISKSLYIKQYLKKRGIEKFEPRTRFEMYQDLKKEDPNIVVKISPSIFTNEINQNIHPLSGISNRKTLYCKENGYFMIYQSDRYGFNNPNEEWDKKEIEYLLVGDSFTHGACVNQPDTIAGNIRSALNQNKKGVLSLGYSGNGPLIEYATLREYFPFTNAKRVLWMYYENDLTDLDRELKNSILLNYLNDKKFTQNIKSRQKEVDKKTLNNLLQEYKITQERSEEEKLFQKFGEYERSYTKRFIKLYSVRDMAINRFFRVGWLAPSPLPPREKEFEKIIKLANELTENNGGTFYFVYLPQIIRYLDFAQNNTKEFRKYEKIVKIVNKLNIPIIDINSELFEKHKDPLSLFGFRRYGHYNEDGYSLVAQIILDKVKSYESVK